MVLLVVCGELQVAASPQTQHYPHAPGLTQPVHSIDYGGAAPHSHHLVVLAHTETEMRYVEVCNH